MSVSWPKLGRFSSLTCLVMILTVLALGGNVLYTASSKSSPKALQNTGRIDSLNKKANRNQNLPANINTLPLAGSLFSSFMPQAASPSVATFEVVSGSCTSTPKTNFVLGESVCAKTMGVSAGSPANSSLTWHNPASFVIQRTDLESSTEDTFIIPTDETSVFGEKVIDNRGVWKVEIVPAGRSVVRAVAYFNVSGATPTHDLNVYNKVVATTDGTVPADSDITVLTIVTNIGPDAATDITLTEQVPANATFQSQGGGSCTNPAVGDPGSSSCAIASIAAGASVEYTFVYHVSPSAPKGTQLASLAQASVDDAELKPLDNQWTARATVTDNANAPACSVGCPANMTVSANSTDGGGNPGAIVNFSGDIEASGDCGTVTSSPASGTFFSVAGSPHTVNVSSSQGGGTCSFTVTVTDSPAPTITCEADQTEPAPSGEGEASVTVNTPTATGTNVAITGVRSDNRAVSDPYPIGTTTITWTARECTNPPDCDDPFTRTATCTQHITVTSVDAPTITCPSNKTFDAGGDCQKTLTEAQIGTPTAGGLNPTVTSHRSDDLALTDPYPVGQTVITWTNTNTLGSVSCSQVITITATGDTTAPTLTVPPDVSVTTSTCSALIDDELGVATATDSCSTVAIARTGVPTVPCPIPGNPTRTCETFVFPVGTTDVTYTATDGAGNVATGVQHVTVHETTPPTFTSVPANLTVNTGAGATSCDTFVGDATLGTAIVADNCDTTVIRTGVPAGNIFPVGTTVITYAAKADLSVTATQTVTVIDDTLPVVTAPAPVTIFTGPGATSCSVTVADLDATLGTGSATDNCPGVGSVTRSGVPAGNVFPVGTTTVTYSATDAHGNTASATQVVTVIDNTVPVITVSGSTPSMWPANHKYKTFQLTGFVTGASDNCGGISISDVVIEKVTSDETENGNGDGNTTNDIVIAADCKSVQLRAERDGGGNGRVYTITFKVTDTHGNVGRATSTVVVPHNPGQTVVDSGVNYTVNGTCP
jgi:Domain of unknown function DUF11/HYR domain